MARDAYIYVLRDPRDSAIRYVGRTIDPEKRLKTHLTVQQEGRKRIEWINELRSKNLTPIMEIIEVCDDECWIQREDQWIGRFLEQGHDLCNAVRRRLDVETPIGISTFVSSQTHVFLKEYAKNRRVSLGKVLNEAVDEYVQRLKKKGDTQ